MVQAPSGTLAERYERGRRLRKKVCARSMAICLGRLNATRSPFSLPLTSPACLNWYRFGTSACWQALSPFCAVPPL